MRDPADHAHHALLEAAPLRSAPVARRQHRALAQAAIAALGAALGGRAEIDRVARHQRAQRDAVDQVERAKRHRHVERHTVAGRDLARAEHLAR